MALDEALLAWAIAEYDRSPLVRIYQWDAPTLSVGATLPLKSEVAARCRDAGVALALRPTGGGAVLHGNDVTYSVVAPIEGRSVIASYRWIATALIAGLRTLGVTAEVIERPSHDRSMACFALPSGADLSAGGRKVCGSAQLRRTGWFLQHGSIPLADLRAQTATLIGSSVVDESTWIEGVSADRLSEALMAGFTEVWGPPARLLADPLALV